MWDNQAPAYYATAKVWSDVMGLSPWMIRIPSLLASVACIALVAALARALVGVRAARTAAWLAAISPFLIQHAQDARPYALLATFATTDLLLLVRFVQGRSARLGVLWVACAFAVVATHYYGIFFLAGQGLALLILRPLPLRSWLPAGVVAGALCAVLVLSALHHAQGVFAGQYVFGLSAMPGVVWSMLTGYTLMPTSEELHSLGPRAVLPFLPIALAALPAFLVVTWAGLRQIGSAGRVVLVTTFAVALVAPFVYRLAAGAGVHPRYFAAAIAPILVVTAVGMTPHDWRSGRGAASIVLVLAMLYASFLHLRDTAHGREDIRGAGQWLEANVPEDEEILITSTEMEILARFHWPNRRFRLYPSDKGTVTPTEIPEAVADLPFDDRSRSIFIVGRAWLSDPDGKLQTALADRYSTCSNVNLPGIRIHCYQADGSAALANAQQ
jgi:4-amino-4-deoxy-L-arabinose transferase-like glycosyltransferase